MKVEYTKTKTDIIYYLAKSVRNRDKVKSVKVEVIGKYSDLIKEHSDPLEYCKQYAKAKTNEEKLIERSDDNVLKLKTNTLLKSESLISSESKELNIGYLYLQAIYQKLKLNELANTIQDNYKFQYNLNDILRYLCLLRVIHPSSKLESFAFKKNVFGNFKFELEDIYKALTPIDKESDIIQRKMYENSTKIIDRNTKVLYYDCTNYYFESETADEDIEDDKGNTIQWGLRKYGASKEHRPNPIVGQGLFVDGNGIPIAMNIYRGNQNEQTTTKPLEKKIIQDFKLSNFIYCSDAGLGSESTRIYNSFNNRHYLVTQSLKKLKAAEQQCIFNDDNWFILTDDIINKKPVKLSDFKNAIDKQISGKELTPDEFDMLHCDMIYKIMRHDINVQTSTQVIGDKVCKKNSKLEEEIVITFSQKYYAYQTKLINRQYNDAKHAIKNSTIKELSKSTNSIKRFIQRINIDKKTGEILDDKIKEGYTLNEDQYKEERRYHGFYAMATNLDYGIKELLEITENRWRIEQSFRLLKSDLNSRPAYVSTESHIKAHFTICFIALTIYRILEALLNKKSDIHFKPNDIISTLKNLNVVDTEIGVYHSIYTNSKVLEKLEEIFKLDLNKENYKYTTLNKTERNLIK